MTVIEIQTQIFWGVEKLDDLDIKDLVEGGISSGQLRDMADILLDLADSIDHYRDRDAYKGRRLRIVKS